MIRHTSLAGLTLALSTTALAHGPNFNFDPFAAPQNTGPSSENAPAIGDVPSAPGSPYLTPTARGWSVTSLLTTGNSVPLLTDSVNSYTMVGIPDGLGAYDNGNGTVTVLMNHEFADTAGSGSGNLSGDEAAEGGPTPPQGMGSPDAMNHGGTSGAFVSEWVIDKNTLKVLSGSDFVTTPSNFFVFDSATNSYVSGDSIPGSPQLNINRLCSANLAPTSAFYNAASGAGYNGKIFMNGEEGGTLGRVFAWVVGQAPGQNTAYELPKFAGSFTSSVPNTPPAFENLLANPSTGDKTVVMGNSDGGTNQVSIYIGTKTKTGTAVDKAGLNDGKMWSIKVDNVTSEDRITNVGVVVGKHGLNSGTTAPVSLAPANSGTTFLRPEDGAWDPRDPNVYYFVTTDRVNLSKPGQNFNPDGTPGAEPPQVGRSRLWAVTFDNVNKIATDGSAIGTIQLLLDGATNMGDNMSINSKGIITLGEDTGNAAHSPAVWQYNTKNGALTQIFVTDPKKFGALVPFVGVTPATAPFTKDKEPTGMVDVTSLFKDAAWYKQGSEVLLASYQPHFKYPDDGSLGTHLAEGGQLDLLTSCHHHEGGDDDHQGGDHDHHGDDHEGECGRGEDDHRGED